MGIAPRPATFWPHADPDSPFCACPQGMSFEQFESKVLGCLRDAQARKRKRAEQDGAAAKAMAVGS